MKRCLLPFCLVFAITTSAQAQTNAVPALAVVAPQPGWVVTPSVPATNEITFAEFLNEVAAANLDYAAQRYNVDIAKAAIALAKEFPNPTLDLGGSHELRYRGRKEADPSTGEIVDQSQPDSVSVGITQTLLLGGKRKWRIQAADQAWRAAAATLEDFLRNLKLDAAKAWAEALATQRTVEQQRKAAGYLGELVAAQRLRLKVGDIGETDLTQSRVDELQFQNDLLNAQNDAETARLALCTFLGRNRGRTTFILRGKLEQEPRAFDADRLLGNALQNRPDLIALRHARDSVKSGVRLAKANRVPDVDVGLNYTHSTETKNFINPTPAMHIVGMSVAFPLPLWSQQRNEIRTAQLAAEQAEKMLQAAELKAEIQVRQTFSAWQLMQERVQKFRGELLKGDDDVLAAKRFSYQRGQATLLELLEAQRTDNEVHQSYNDALADVAKALIELERAAQLWDVSF